MKAHVVVCGDSYCSAEATGPRDHFSQILQDDYGYQVTNLARGGMSTVGICFQLREALSLNPQVVIYNTTTPDRVNLVMHDGFDISQGLKNFSYPFQADESAKNPLTGGKDAPIFSTVWQQLEHIVSAEQYRAIEQHLVHLFDWDLQQEIDRWMIEYWTIQLEQAGIKTLAFTRNDFEFVYLFGRAHPNINRVFHTDRATQVQAAEIINKKLRELLTDR